MIARFFTLVLLAAILVPCPARCDVRIGIYQYGQPDRDRLLQQEARYIADRLGTSGTAVQIIGRTGPGLEKDVRDGRLDFVISSSGFCVRMQEAGLTPLASITTQWAPNPNFVSGSLFLARRDIKAERIADLKGLRCGATYQLGFNGYVVAMSEIARQGFNPDTFFRRMEFFPQGTASILSALEKGTIDAAILEATLWEELPAAVREHFVALIKPIGVRTDPGYSRLHSTRLFPGMTFAGARSADPESLRRILVALLDKPQNSPGWHWGVPTNYNEVDGVYRLLRMGPYAYLREWTVRRVVREFWPAGVILLMLIAGLILHSLRSDSLVRRRTAELVRSLEEQRRIEQESALKSDRINALQRSGTITQIGRLFVHEVRQPLASVDRYLRGLERLAERLETSGARPADTALLREALSAVAKENSRAEAIVQKVYDYAKGRRAKPQRLDLGQLAEQAVQDWTRARPATPPVQVKADSALMIRGNPLETELLILNLLRNAVEAVAGIPEAEIRISVLREGASALLCVEDNGMPPADDLIARLNQGSIATTREDGLGLGLALVRTIVESEKGTIGFARSAMRGLKVEIRIPEDKEASHGAA